MASKLEVSKSAIGGLIGAAVLKYIEFLPDELAWNVWAIWEPAILEEYVREVKVYVAGGVGGAAWWRSRNPNGRGFGDDAKAGVVEPGVSPVIPNAGNGVQEQTTRRLAQPETRQITATPPAPALLDRVQLRHELERDEGVKYEIYRDSEGYPTLGIGHLITPEDPEYGEPIGTPVSADTVERYYQQDVQEKIDDTRVLFPKFDSFPHDLKLILVNMMFNLGMTRLRKFKRMRAAIDARDWDRAATEMLDSKYARQVKGRANRLASRMVAIGDGPVAIA